MTKRQTHHAHAESFVVSSPRLGEPEAIQIRRDCVIPLPADGATQVLARWLEVNPDLTFDAAKERLRAGNFSFSERTFRHGVWKHARVLAGLAPRGEPGRPKKK